jgi:hypothetical protein
LCTFIFWAFKSIDEKSSQQELVGKYHISKVTVHDFQSTAVNTFKLEFKHNSTFGLTPTPYIHVCDKEKFSVDYRFENNELTVMCSNETSIAHIDLHLGYYPIEFIIGGSDSGESIFFEKDK